MSSRDEADAQLPGERQLIDRIRQRLPPHGPDVVVGPGDDAAVVVPERGAFQVLTTDALVEGIHFDRRFSSLRDVGYKALAVNLSDLAAMGATPAGALLSLMLPEGTTVGEVDRILDGLLDLAEDTRVTLLGGNISRSPGPLIIDVTATGHVRPRRVLTRAGGHPGDAIYVTGTIGEAAAGLEYLKSTGEDPDRPASGMAECVTRHQRPDPRVRFGMLLGRNRAATACMDLSDGLADAVIQIARASGTGAVVEAEAVPVAPAAREWFAKQGRDPVTAAIAAGDDFELLFTSSKKLAGRLRAVSRAARGLPIARIGELTAGPEVALSRNGVLEPLPAGFSHF